jgi:hypothetical protein
VPLSNGTIVKNATADTVLADQRGGSYIRRRTSGCARQAFIEQVAQSFAGMRTTTPLRAAVAVGRDQPEVASTHRVSWLTVHRAVVVHGTVELLLETGE